MLGLSTAGDGGERLLVWLSAVMGDGVVSEFMLGAEDGCVISVMALLAGCVGKWMWSGVA